jgi:MerR family transcriptional regulator, light-induced transcriptional regulator
MGVYTIRELENLSGIKAHTIRIWEKRFGLIAPQRTSTNIRTYCDSELKKILNISILNRNGLKISKIARLSQEEVNAMVRQYTHEVTSAEGQIESLTMSMIDVDEYRFEQVLSRSIIQFGFEDAITRVLFPFFIRIGTMWQTGAVNAAQEHFISNLVKQKIYAAIDGLLYAEDPAAKKLVFFLPEGEMHEIGLLFMCYLARKRGHRTVYLGQSVPLNDLVELVRQRNIDFLVTSIITTINGIDPAAMIRTFSELFSDKILFLTGSPTVFNSLKIPANIRFVNSSSHFLQELQLASVTVAVS